jgi:hypothetical protein
MSMTIGAYFGRGHDKEIGFVPNSGVVPPAGATSGI